MTIPTPPRPEGHPDRFLDAQEAIEASLLDMVDQAIAAGWGEREAIAAVVAVAENRILGLAENDETNDQLRRISRWTGNSS